jgi:hypothetical protein
MENSADRLVLWASAGMYDLCEAAVDLEGNVANRNR